MASPVIANIMPDIVSSDASRPTQTVASWFLPAISSENASPTPLTSTSTKPSSGETMPQRLRGGRIGDIPRALEAALSEPVAYPVPATSKALEPTARGVKIRPHRTLNSTALPFDFLRLPKELRLMVYESLPWMTRHHPMKGQTSHPQDYPLVFFVQRLVDAAILQTCRLVHTEAKPIIERMRMKKVQTPRLVVMHGFAYSASKYLDDVVGIPGPFITRVYHIAPPYNSPFPCPSPGFIRRTRQMWKTNRSFEFAIWIPPYVPADHVIETLPSLARRLTLHSRFIPSWKVNITITIQGLDLQGCEDRFEAALHLVRTWGIDLVGVKGTPEVDWAEHWGIEDMGDLDWTHGNESILLDPTDQSNSFGGDLMLRATNFFEKVKQKIRK